MILWIESHGENTVIVINKGGWEKRLDFGDGNPEIFKAIQNNEVAEILRKILELLSFFHRQPLSNTPSPFFAKFYLRFSCLTVGRISSGKWIPELTFHSADIMAMEAPELIAEVFDHFLPQY